MAPILTRTSRDGVFTNQYTERHAHEAILAWIDERLDALEAGTQVPFAVADALRARSVALLTGAEYAPLQDG